MKVIKRITVILMLQVALLGGLNVNLMAEGEISNLAEGEISNLKVMFANFQKMSKLEQQSFLRDLTPEQREILQKALENESLYRMLIKSIVNGKIGQSFIWPGLMSLGFGSYKFLPCLFNQCTLESSKNILGGSGNVILGFVLMALATKTVNRVMG